MFEFTFSANAAITITTMCKIQKYVIFFTFCDYYTLILTIVFSTLLSAITLYITFTVVNCKVRLYRCSCSPVTDYDHDKNVFMIYQNQLQKVIV